MQIRDSPFAIAFAKLLTEPVSFECSHVPAQAIHRCAIVAQGRVDAAQIEIRLDFQSHIATPLRDRQGALTGLKGAVLLTDEEQMKARVEENSAQAVLVAERHREAFCMREMLNHPRHFSHLPEGRL